MAKDLWAPLPPYLGELSSQAMALACPCDEILYHGTRGPGKTEAQIAYFCQHVGKGYGRHWRGIIFDRGYKNLDDLIAKSRALMPKIHPGAKFLTSKSDLKWKFPGGEELLFRHMQRLADYDQYHGHEYPFIGWNELTNFPTAELYDTMGSCNRSSFLPVEHSPKLTARDREEILLLRALGEDLPPVISTRLLPPIPLVTFSTTNPHGPGHTWVKRRFISGTEPGLPKRDRRKVFDPQTRRMKEVEISRVNIFGSYKENRFLDAKYIATLDAITDPNKRAAWLEGSWDVTSGGALDDLWRADRHVLPRFIIPPGWKLTRSFDWGSTHPFSVGFWAVSNGEEFTAGGVTRCVPRGSLVRFSEIYGAETTRDGMGRLVIDYGTNRGLKLPAAEVARRIVEHVEELREDGWISSDPEPGPADGQIFNINESETDSIAKLMAAEGVEWYSANKSRGSRKIGLELFRARLEAARIGEGKGIFVTSNCSSFLETVPNIPRDPDDPDDVDTGAEDHIFDESRYMILDDKPDTADGFKMPKVY